MSGSSVHRHSATDFNNAFSAQQRQSGSNESTRYHAKSNNQYQPRALNAIYEELQLNHTSKHDCEYNTADDSKVDDSGSHIEPQPFNSIVPIITTVIDNVQHVSLHQPDTFDTEINIDDTHNDISSINAVAPDTPISAHCTQHSNNLSVTDTSINTSFSPVRNNKRAHEPSAREINKRINKKQKHLHDRSSNNQSHRIQLGVWNQQIGMNHKHKVYTAMDGNKYTGTKAYIMECTDNVAKKNRNKLCNKPADNNTNGTIHINQLQYWNVPTPIVNEYKNKHINELYEWQHQCLSQYHEYQQLHATAAGHLLYTAPTSGGKTLIAEILCLNHIIQQQKKILFILPYHSIIEEKQSDLCDKLQQNGITVLGQHSKKNPHIHIYDNIDMILCTAERANILCNEWIQNNTLHNIGIVVIDELHLLSGNERGANLEILISKILYYNTYNTNKHTIRLIGMSATVSNVSNIQRWFGMENTFVYKTDTRPIELNEYVVIGENSNACINKHNVLCNIIKYKSNHTPVSTNDQFDVLIELIYDMQVQGQSILIFANQIKRTKHIVDRLLSIPQLIQHHVSDGIISKRLDIVQQMSAQEEQCDSTLKQSIIYGIAYHNARLTELEKQLIENGFKYGIINVLISTTTLATGVNLPAQRVVFRDGMNYRASEMINTTEYKQMCGRAGRTGYNILGESIILCSEKYKSDVLKLMNSEIPALRSVLLDDTEHIYLQHAILELIVSSQQCHKTQIYQFVDCTLFAQQSTSSARVRISVDSAIDQLVNTQSIICSNDTYTCTQLGRAAHVASIAPTDKDNLMNELIQYKRNGICLSSTLHQCYIVCQVNGRSAERTSIVGNDTIVDILQYLISHPQHCKTLQRLGISDQLIRQIQYNRPYDDDTCFIANVLSERAKPDYIKCYRVICAYFIVCMIDEDSATVLCQRYNVLDKISEFRLLMVHASQRCHMLCKFMGTLNWTPFTMILTKLIDRLDHQVKPELIELMRIPYCTVPLARILYNHKLTNCNDIIHAGADHIYNIFRSYNQHMVNDQQYTAEQLLQMKLHNDMKLRNQAADIYRSAKLIKIKY